MSEPNFSSDTPQFATAEYASKGGPDRCQSCGQAIGDTYFRVNGALACPNCAQRAAGSLPTDSHTTFVRGVMFGVGGAILGMILYAAFSILTGLIIGYVALAVGYIVAKAIKTGSGGMGGQRYQIAAALLTYAAVSIAAIPVGISQFVKARDARVTATHTQALRNLPGEDAPSADANDTDPSSQAQISEKIAVFRFPAEYRLRPNAILNVNECSQTGFSKSEFFEMISERIRSRRTLSR